jgi:hypothetical protein
MKKPARPAHYLIGSAIFFIALGHNISNQQSNITNALLFMVMSVLMTRAGISLFKTDIIDKLIITLIASALAVTGVAFTGLGALILIREITA